ncbi:MAG: tRNA (adenosine(37)-N6)-dimethylallyltransferase MiaA [Mesorhizobium amorphae]|nr:MAG: tRNA (adenosine(37)-N6)-dimethylallyltransferase MiaA [Mesorhizobium amorphae]
MRRACAQRGLRVTGEDLGQHGTVGVGDQDGDKGHGQERAPLIENAILLAGPTASGKSALALELAERLDGLIVNADSMQVYDGLRILSARPSLKATERVPHLLYGHVPPQRSYSVGAWLDDVVRLVEEGALRRRAIFVGGTGLYFKALTEGLAVLPDIPADVRAFWRDRLVEHGAVALHAELADRDPSGAAILAPTDGQRLVRALEVWDATGRPLREWQSAPATPLVSGAIRVVLEPPRPLLRERIDRRFDAMMAEGALDEAVRVASLVPDPAAPSLKAIGLRQLLDHAAGKLSLEAAIAQSKVATHQYAKRQSTWFRNQFGGEWQHFAGPGEAFGKISA